MTGYSSLRFFSDSVDDGPRLYPRRPIAMHSRARPISALRRRPPEGLRGHARACAFLVGVGLATGGCDKPTEQAAPTPKTAAAEKAAPAPKTPSGERSAATPTKPSAKQAAPAKPKPEAAAPSDQEEPAGVTQENLDRFIPNELGGLKRLETGNPLSVTEGPLLAHGAYVIDGGKGKRMVNVNLMEVVDLEFERAQFVVGKGESKDDGNTVGKEIDGRLVQRRFYGSPPKSELIVLLADRIVVRVSVESAASADEGFAYLADVDLAGLESLTR